MQKLGSNIDFGQEAILGLAAEGLPDLVSALPEAAASLPQTPSIPPSAAQAKPARTKAAGADDLMPPPALKTIYDRVAAEEGVPVNILVAMGHTESGHRPDIDGPQTRYGAAGGIMQYLPGMAAAHKINRYNPEESIRQAAKDLRERLTKNKGDMANAVARHHAGDNPEQLGPKSRAYAEKILGKASKLADVYEADQAAQLKGASKAREAAREQAAEAKRAEYYPQSGAVPAPTSRTWLQAGSDTLAQLAEGVNTIAGAPAELIAPDSGFAQFFRDGADYWRSVQSEDMQRRIAQSDKRIARAGEDGLLAQMAAAASEYTDDPALAARLVATNAASLIPGVAAAKLAQAAAIARGATAAKAAAAATAAAGGVNAVLNAGGARGEAYQDLRQTLIAKGMAPEAATEVALRESLPSAAAGGLAGFLSGKIGLEKALVGQGGVGVRGAAGAAAAELAGEQLEEVTPQIATNLMAGQYDGRSLLKDVGRTIVETGIASGPGAAVSAAVAHGPIGRAVEKAQAAPAAPGTTADDAMDRPPIDEPMFISAGQESAAGGVAPTEDSLVPDIPAWGHLPAIELAGQPVEVGRKENFAADYPIPPAPDAAAIADVDARVAGAREQEAAAQRRQILDDVLSDSAVRNPVAKFAAELARAGYAQAMPSADELATIERFSAVKDTFAGIDPDATPQAPAAPNAMGDDEAVDWRAQRDAEIMGEAEGDSLAQPVLQDPPAQVQQAESGQADEVARSVAPGMQQGLPPELAAIADQSRAANQFIKLLRKAGHPVENEREMVALWKAHKAKPAARQAVAPAMDTGVGAGAQPAAATPAPSATQGSTPPAPNAQLQMPQPVAATPAKLNNWHKKAAQVDIERDTVRDAVARLGGIRKDEAMREWGATLVEGTKSRIFGKPVFRAKGGAGLPLDKMREALAELGYLPADSDINDLYQAFEQDSLHHVGQERRAAVMAQQVATENQAMPAGEAAAMPERTLDNHPVYDPWYDFDPGTILPDDLNEAAASAGDLISPDYQAEFEVITTELNRLLGVDEAESILERAAIMGDAGRNFFEAIGELINERQNEQTQRSSEPGGEAAEAPTGQTGTGTASDIQQEQPDAGRSDDEAGQPGGDDAGILQSYDQAELDAREQAQRAAEARRQEEERAADRKRQADAEVGDFVLTGSDSMADQLAARGQGGLFDAPNTAPSIEQTAPNISADDSTAADGAVAAKAEQLDFPTKEIADSYRHISHRGSDSAKAEENAFNQSVEQIRSEVGALAETEAQQAAFDSAMADYKRGYIDASLKVARAREGTMSPLVAGRNNFNGKQAARTGGAYEKAQDEFARKVGRLKAAVEEAVRDARTPEQVQAEQDKAAEKARKKSILDFAKAAGAIADDLRNDRKAMASDTRKWANKDMMALLDGMDEATQRQAIEGSDKALKELGGLSAVVGPRSTLGKRVATILAITPQDGESSRGDSVIPDGARLSVAEADSSNLGGEKASTDLAFHFRTEAGKSFTGGLKVDAVQSIISDVTRGWKNLPAIEAVQGFDELPADIQQECRRQGGHEYSIQGILSRKSNKVYVVAGNHEWAREVEATLFHEIIGHYGLGILTSDDAGEVQAEHLRLFKKVGGRNKLMEMANRFGVAEGIESYRKNLQKTNWSQATQAAVLFDELIAHIAEKQPSGWRHALRLAHGYLRAFLRQAGFKRLSTLNDADIAVLVNEAARAVRSSAKSASKRASKMSIANAQAGLPLSIDDLHDVFRQSPLGSWVDKLISSGRLTIKPNLVLPEGYKHLEATQAFTVDGKITMFAGNIGGRQRVMPVLLHEVFHSSGEALLGGKEWGKLIAELDQLRQHAESNPAGKAGKLWGDAKRRVQEAIENGDNMTRADMAEELGAYAIELADQAPLTWQRWVDRFLGHVKAWARRVFGVQLGRLTPEQLRALAIAALREGSTTAGPGPRLSVREKEVISMKEGNFPGADARDSNIALGRDAQRRLLSEHPTWAQRLRDIGLKGLRPTLSMLPGNTVVDLYRHKLPALEIAQKQGERLDGMRQTLQKEADEAFRAWEKLPADAADKMADLMHEATIWQLHPDQPAPDKLSKKWAAKHAQLADDWAALPVEAQAVYRQVRDLYAKRTGQMFDALADRIGRMSGLGAGARSKMLADLRERFDKTLGEGPYFPLSRFGDYLVVAKRLDSDGKTLEKVVLAAETEHEQRMLQQDLMGRGFDVVELDKAAKNFRASSLGTDLSGFAAGLIDKLDGVEMSDDQRADILDDINQMLIDALPPASARKHFKHRKGVPGFSNDAVRAFVRSQASMASHIANITYQDRIDKALQDARKQAKQDQANVNELGSVVDEMEERAELARRFVAHPIANALTQLGFANFLGFSLSQGLLNLTQVPLLTYPALAAKFGEAKTHAALRGAYAKVGRALTKKGGETWGDVRTLENLDDDSRRILKAMEERGKLDLTMALDLVRGGAGSQAPGRHVATRAAQWVGRYSGWFNHISEAANRQVTAIAGYKLALGQGMSRDQAVDYVAKLLDDSQFNYAFSNRPRLLMSNAGRVIGLMHTFAINAMYRIGRNLYHAMGSWNTEEGREARSIMLRILTVQTALAGLSSLPLLPLAGAAAGTAIHKATGSRVLGAVGVMAGVGLAQALVSGMGADDDEPWDFDAERRRILNDITGSRTIAELLDKGLLRALGMDVANRISMNDLLMRDVDTGFTSKPAQTWLDNAFLQSIGGAAYGAIKQYARATDMWMDGQYHRAVEATLPKFASDVLKAIRYAYEGVRVPVGPATAHKADVTAYDVAKQALGFTPSTVAEVNSSERAQRKAVAQMQARRGELLEAWVVARLEKNSEAEKGAVARITKFNQTQRENGSVDLIITGADRMSKLRSQKRSVERREDGQQFGRKYRGIAESAGGMYGEE